MLSDLQVDVNGQQTFSLSLKLLASFSGKLRKMFDKSAAFQTGNLKLIFHDFPGGAEGFELIVRFCYNGGKIDVTPSNILLLHSAAKFMEIVEGETKKYFENIHFLTWSELLDCLKQSQHLLSFVDSFLVQEILNAVVEKVSMPNISSPFAFSSSDYSSTRFSGDISTNSSRCSSFQSTNWLQDLEFLTVDSFEKVLNAMISNKLDHGMVCSFLLHYQKMKSMGVLAADEKRKLVEVVINSLCYVNGGSNFPFRRLCDVLRVCSTLRMGRSWEKIVEKMIGCRLDEATLDDLMVPSRSRKGCAYDVNLILRFMKIFLAENRKQFGVQRLKKAGFLIDSYLAEVAPDPLLKPCKFLALVLCLPDPARESYDRVYEIIHMYFKVHGFISEEEKIKICSVLNYDKISSESLLYLAENNDFPACVASDALVILQSRRKNASKDEKNVGFRGISSLSGEEDEQILEHLSEAKECRKVQKNLVSVDRISVTCPRTGRSLPILCS